MIYNIYLSSNSPVPKETWIAGLPYAVTSARCFYVIKILLEKDPLENPNKAEIHRYKRSSNICAILFKHKTRKNSDDRYCL